MCEACGIAKRRQFGPKLPKIEAEGYYKLDADSERVLMSVFIVLYSVSEGFPAGRSKALSVRPAGQLWRLKSSLKSTSAAAPSQILQA